MQMTPENQKIVDVIVRTIRTAQDEEDDGAIARHHADIVLFCDLLIAADQRLVAFVRDILELCSRESLRVWSSTAGASLGDSAWSRLADDLTEVLAGPNAAG